MLDAAAGIQALLNSSRALYDELLSAEGIDCEWDTHGLLFVFQSAGRVRPLRRRRPPPAGAVRAAGRAVRRGALLKLEPALKPGAAAGGYLYQSDAQLRPDRLMSEWRTVLDRLGVTSARGAS